MSKSYGFYQKMNNLHPHDPQWALDPIVKECVGCGEEFDAFEDDQEYCTDECKEEHGEE